MKGLCLSIFFLIFIMGLSSKACAENLLVSDSVFAARYPNFQNYQSLSLQGLQNYFYALISKSVVIQGPSHSIVLLYQNDKGETLLTINAKIERIRTENTLTERVLYVLPDSTIFDYSLKQSVAESAKLQIEESNDVDLLTMNFTNTKYDYELLVMPFQTRFIKSHEGNFEKALINFGFMDISIAIETKFLDNEASREYIYFYAGMPNPQTSIKVTVLDDESPMHNLNYIHTSSGSVMSPSLFFKGLQDGAQIFSDFSMISLVLIKGKGFPAIKGIN
jgi:hypothetical protein